MNEKYSILWFALEESNLKFVFQFLDHYVLDDLEGPKFTKSHSDGQNVNLSGV